MGAAALEPRDPARGPGRRGRWSREPGSTPPAVKPKHPRGKGLALMHRTTVRRSVAGAATLVAVAAVPSVSAADASRTAGAGPSPRVQVMVVGPTGTLF